MRNQLYQLNVVNSEDILEDGRTVLMVTLAKENLRQMLAKAHVSFEDALPEHQAALFRRPLEAFERPDTNAEDLAADLGSDPDVADDWALDDDLLDTAFDADEPARRS